MERGWEGRKGANFRLGFYKGLSQEAFVLKPE
jgi:hypothetical protein